MRGMKLPAKLKTKKVKRKPGHPPGKGLFKQEYKAMLIDHMSRGYTYRSFAGVAEVTMDTLYDWEERHEGWKDAKDIAFGKCRMWWERVAIESFTNKEQISAALWISNMKLRFKDTIEDLRSDRTVVQVRNETNVGTESEQKLVQEFKDVIVSYRDERKIES
jgi:hypothetical protein